MWDEAGAELRVGHSREGWIAAPVRTWSGLKCGKDGADTQSCPSSFYRGDGCRGGQERVGAKSSALQCFWSSRCSGKACRSWSWVSEGFGQGGDGGRSLAFSLEAGVRVSFEVHPSAAA